MREMSVAEQRYRAMLAVVSDGRTVTETAAAVGVSRQTMHGWLGQYEAGGLDGLGDGSHRPRGCPHQAETARDEPAARLAALPTAGVAVERYKKATAR